MKVAYKLIDAKLKASVLDTPEAKLMYAIWSQALADVMTRPLGRLPYPTAEQVRAYNGRVGQMAHALEFITSGPPVLAAAGLEQDYAWRIIHEVCERRGVVIAIPPKIEL